MTWHGNLQRTAKAKALNGISCCNIYLLTIAANEI